MEEMFGDFNSFETFLEAHDGPAPPTANEVMSDDIVLPREASVTEDGDSALPELMIHEMLDQTEPPNSPVATRKTPRRMTRSVKRYIENDEDYEEEGKDPDYSLSDSDNDPEFTISSKKHHGKMEEDFFLNRKKGRFRGRGIGNRGRPIKRSLENEVTSSTKDEEVVKKANLESNGNSDSCVSSTEQEFKKKSYTSPALNSSYVYASGLRPNQRVSVTPAAPISGPLLQTGQFKTGDFIMAKKDVGQNEAPIWKIDGKSLLQKFQPFEKDGKILYRNISTYSGWTQSNHPLYLLVRIKFVYQSRYDIVVEVLEFPKLEDAVPGLEGSTVGVDADKVSQETKVAIEDAVVINSTEPEAQAAVDMSCHMSSFEIYLQSLISQALDANFLQEIYDEKDEYFVDKVKEIDTLASDRQQKISRIFSCDEKLQQALNVWPGINVVPLKVESLACQCCKKDVSATKVMQLYGVPYHPLTMQSKEVSAEESDAKKFEVCDPCLEICQMYNKMSHQKYDFFTQCRSTVSNMRVTSPSKNSTSILRDLLANDDWISKLFKDICATWAQVDEMCAKRGEVVPEEVTGEGS